MQKKKETIIISAIAESDRIWSAWHKPDVCIAACRTLQIALRDYGVRLDPIVARVRILNPAMIALVDAGVIDDYKTEADRIAAFDRLGAWGVGIGYEPVDVMIGVKPRGANKWGSHLALVDRTSGFFVDPTIGQGSRPAKGLPVPQSVYGRLSDGAIAGDLAALVMLPGGIEATYVLFPSEDGSWLRSPDWREPKRFKSEIKRIQQAIKNGK